MIKGKSKVLFDFTNSQTSESYLKKASSKLGGELKIMKKVLSQEYDEKHTSINLCSDKDVISECKEVFKKVKDFDTLFVVGIGGSNLGTAAVYNAIKGNMANEMNSKKIYFADTVDSDYISDLISIMNKEIKAKRKVLINVISKSGSTAETIGNFDVLVSVLKKHDKNYVKNVIVTSAIGSKLYKYGESCGFHLLNHQNIGGRFSVLSNVGIFPLMCMGIDVVNLHKGAQDMRNKCLKDDISKNPAIQGAASIYNNYKKGNNILDTFLFSKNLEDLGKWERQLIGESLGKQWNKSHTKQIFTGMTPTVSVGSVDLHSVAQLYLGGPKDKFWVFVKPCEVSKVSVSKNKEIDLIIKDVSGKKLSFIMDAIFGGVRNAFVKKKRPFYEISFSKVDEFTIGGFLQMKMIEVMFLGVLMDVNVFDQPNVEDYKIITKDLLSKSK